ncbi:long-chain-fatty-acid--CoA ligase [Variovorax sp. M-6]|uniref:long-chain-fatty-acid--CoA ligase n=1 Tax=Variovorax sp. M-6 TaxID=3233041 RepID=UPI003F97FFCA
MSAAPGRPKHWPRHLPAQLTVPGTSLWFNLEVSAARYPEKPAYLFFGRALPYAELRQQAVAIAGWLQAAGVGKGDRVLLQMQNCPQFVVAYYAIVRADAVVVPVSPMNTVEELRHYLEDAQATAAICTADVAATLCSAIGGLGDGAAPAVLVTRYADALPMPPASQDIPPELEAMLLTEHALPAGCERWTDALARSLTPRPHEARPSDMVMLPYTSGTTGRPKGCIHTHETLMPNALAGAMWPQMSASSCSLAALPMFHITGLVFGVLSNVYLGATAVVMPRWNRELAGRWIAEYGVTHFACIPTMVIDMFASPNYRSFGLEALCNLIGGGSAMPQAVAERLKQEFDIDFAEGYGLTETAAMTLINPIERAKLQCLGIPIFGNDVRIVDPETGVELPTGQAGEIVLRGATVFRGYWRQPEATAQAFKDIAGKSFFRTGDIGYRDEEGYFFVTDRLKRMINASGFKVWPAEVEALLYRNPAVQEACVVGVPDDYRGETVKAVVVLRQGLKPQQAGEDLIAWAKTQMAAYKVPRVVDFVDELPKSASGKVLWREVQRQHATSA